MATILTQSDTSRPVSAGYKVDISRGQRIGRVSSEWFSRPDDERFLSLSSLHAAVKSRAERATARTVETRDVKVEASRDDAERLALLVPGRDEPVMPTHWSFGQLCSLVGAPAGYARIADTVDELDAFILTALEELRGLDIELDGIEAEVRLADLWRRTFTVAAAAQEAWLEQAILRRGRAIVSDIYPDAEERRRLYQYGFSPYVGRRFEAVAPQIASFIEAAADYGSEDPATRLSHFINIGELLKEDRGFGFRIRDTQTDKRMLENWTDILAWWMRSPGADHPAANDLRSRQRFVSDNLEFRLGTAVGGVVAQRWTEGAGDPLAVPSLADWRATTGLPWFGFWARELLRWGTLDPFVAFVLAQGRAKTREAAEALRPEFDQWLADEIDDPSSDDLIDPQQFLAWERALPRRTREAADELPVSAFLSGTDGGRKRYNVLPIAADEKVIWIDPAGFELARSDDPLGMYSLRDVSDDFVLATGGRQSTVSRTFRRRNRRA